MRREREADWARQAERRALAAGGEATAEDRIVRALLVGSPESLALAARLRAGVALIDHGDLAYWVDELGLRERWTASGASLRSGLRPGVR